MLCAALTFVGTGVAVGSTHSEKAGAATNRAAKASSKGDPAVTRRLALAAGLQVAKKSHKRPTVTVRGKRYAAPNPLLAHQMPGSDVDYSYWRRVAAEQGKRQAAQKTPRVQGVNPPTPYTHTEQEPVGQVGSNDTRGTAEQLTKLGVNKQFQGVNVRGQLSPPTVPTPKHGTREDQGSIPDATRTGIGTLRQGVKVTSKIGDGPHGRAGDGHGDFDFFRLHLKAGQSVSATTSGSSFDTVLVVYDSAGHIVASNDDANEDSITSKVAYRSESAAYVYVMVSGFSFSGSVPEDPFRSGSGSGAGEQGTYQLSLTGSQLDVDDYAVQLASGDVLGGVMTGNAKTVSVQRLNGQTAIGSQQDASVAYPPQSPLPGGGNTFAYVAEEPGWYTVSVDDGKGAYKVLLETYAAGATRAQYGAVQTIFLDFDGERLNTGIFGGPGVRSLSPLSTFLPKWGLTRADEDAVIDATVARVRHIAQNVQANGLNNHVRVNLLNSRDDPDPFGQPNVSRVVVGGTIDQSGIPTIGISQSIDPGNFGHEETALVLLDEVSLPKGAEDSFNTFFGPSSNRVGFIGQGLGNLAAHEIGHMVGSFHTDSLDSKLNLMDSGGIRFDRFYGVGPDGIGGTADDRDVEFGKDDLDPEEGFLGVEDSLNFTAWAFLAGTA